MKRVEQGVPLETLDLRTCVATNFDFRLLANDVRLLCEIVVDVLAPAREVAFVSPDNYGVGDYSDDDGDGDSNASDDYEERYGDEWEGEEEEN